MKNLILKQGAIDPEDLPPIDKKPKIVWGWVQDLWSYPVVRNFSTVLRWIYHNFATKDEIKKMIEEGGIVPPEQPIAKIDPNNYGDREIVEALNAIIDVINKSRTA